MAHLRICYCIIIESCETRWTVNMKRIKYRTSSRWNDQFRTIFSLKMKEIFLLMVHYFYTFLCIINLWFLSRYYQYLSNMKKRTRIWTNIRIELCKTKYREIWTAHNTRIISSKNPTYVIYSKRNINTRPSKLYSCYTADTRIMSKTI